MQIILANSFFFPFHLIKKHSSFIFLCKIRVMDACDCISKQEEQSISFDLLLWPYQHTVALKF